MDINFKKDQFFRANGKLLISAEYLVLHGAKALALPLKSGQTMQIKNTGSGKFEWLAQKPSENWFSAVFDNALTIINTSNPRMAGRLQSILGETLSLAGLKPEILNGIQITTKLEFDPDWGWGSSSTLISNLADWLKINPYPLLSRTFGGSGYDLACAKAPGPVFYHLDNQKEPVVKPAEFFPKFEEKIWIVYLNKKQSSAQAISAHQKNNHTLPGLIEKASQLTREMSDREISMKKFMELMVEHETLISGFTQLEPVKNRLFPEYPGAVKSLGAWGGDFILALSHLSDQETKTFFQTKGYPVLFKLKNIRLDNDIAK